MRGGGRIDNVSDLQKLFPQDDAAKFQIFDAFALDYGLNNFDELYKEILKRTGQNFINTNEVATRFLSNSNYSAAKAVIQTVQ